MDLQKETLTGKPLSRSDTYPKTQRVHGCTPSFTTTLVRQRTENPDPGRVLPPHEVPERKPLLPIVPTPFPTHHLSPCPRGSESPKSSGTVRAPRVQVSSPTSSLPISEGRLQLYTQSRDPGPRQPKPPGNLTTYNYHTQTDSSYPSTQTVRIHESSPYFPFSHRVKFVSRRQ